MSTDLHKYVVLFETVPWDVNDRPNNQTAKHNEGKIVKIQIFLFILVQFHMISNYVMYLRKNSELVVLRMAAI